MGNKTYLEAWNEIEVGDYVEIVTVKEGCYDLNIGRVIQGYVTGTDYNCMLYLDRMNDYPEGQGDIMYSECFNFDYVWGGEATIKITKGSK